MISDQSLPFKEPPNLIQVLNSPVSMSSGTSTGGTGVPGRSVSIVSGGAGSGEEGLATLGSVLVFPSNGLGYCGRKRSHWAHRKGKVKAGQSVQVLEGSADTSCQGRPPLTTLCCCHQSTSETTPLASPKCSKLLGASFPCTFSTWSLVPTAQCPYLGSCG